MKIPRPTFEGRLLRRYKRFLADVRTREGRELTVHCPNPGSMAGCAEAGSRVVVSDSEDPKRKLRHTLEMVRVGRTWVGVNTALTNAVAREGIERGLIPELSGYAELKPEVRYGENSRVDFLLSDGDRRCWVEVKNTTLAESDTALFPDSVTERGLKHLRELQEMKRQGDRAVMLFLVNREDCTVFRPAAAIDPDYAAGLVEAARTGVEVLCYAARVKPRSITVDRRVPATPRRSWTRGL